MIEHLLELRRRFIIVLLIFTTVFVLLYCCSSFVFESIVSPLIQLLPRETGLVATQITMPILLPLSLSADLALLCTTPFALFHLWRFAAPGLYRHEQKGIGITVITSLVLFILGALFCFYGVLPYVFQLFVKAVPSGVRYMPDMASAVDFITRMIMLFGLCFQVPLVCVLLIKTGLMDIATLKKARPYWIVIAFILGMLLTPPDVLSQVTLAIPLCLLYELGVIMAVLMCRRI